jgi:hypothetical protein
MFQSNSIISTVEENVPPHQPYDPLLCEPDYKDEPNYSVGSTVAAGMCDDVENQKISTRSASDHMSGQGVLQNTEFYSRNAGKLVQSVLSYCMKGLGAKAPTIRLVESLIWPFVARRMFKSPWFSDKEYKRFIRSMQKTAILINSYISEDNQEQTYIKYWLDYYLWQGFRDENPPVRPSFVLDPLFSGWCKRFVARAITKGDFSFLYSLQKGSKQAWPNLGEIKKSEALLLHAERLTTPKGPLPLDLEKMINKTSLRIFKSTNNPKRINTLGKKFLPSGSACLQASRREGGALSLVDRYSMPWGGERPKTRQNTDFDTLGKLPSLGISLNEWRNDEYEKVLRHSYHELIHSDRDVPESLKVRIVALAEPAKFRILSLGDGYLYSSLQPVQGLMIDDWKNCIASTMLTPDLEGRVNEIESACTELPFWCSADYSAATDLLKKASSMAVFDPLENMPLKNLASVAMHTSSAVYPDGTEIVAIEGQLMGHPLSFPALCCINLSVYHCSIERWIERASSKKEATYRKRLGRTMWNNVIVNGDDMLFKCTKDFYTVFKETAADAGFLLSTGKNYLSTRAAMINSQLFEVKNRANGSHFMKRVGYLNQRLLYGNFDKSGGDATPVQIATSTNDMIHYCPWAACAIPSIMSRWKKDWFGRYQPNWYVPAHLGGMGLDRKYAPADWKISKSQRELAARFIADPRMVLYRIKGMDIPTAKLAGAIANWKLVIGDYVETDSESQTENDAWLARLAYAARAHHGSKPVSDNVFISKFKPQYRLKPMSPEVLELYWDARLYASKLPSCPPIGKIKLPIWLRSDRSFVKEFIKPE